MKKWLRKLSSGISSSISSSISSPLEKNHLHNLQNLIGMSNILINQEDIDSYCHDWTRHYCGGCAVSLPSSSDEVSKILSYCYENEIQVVPQGGNTGLVGGGVGLSQELIISSQKMNRVISIDPVAGVLVCEAGCIIQHLMEFVAEYGLYLPIDLGSKGSCAIGGTISTNAGGMRVLRYGSWHQNVLGMEVILSNGATLDMLRTFRKDNCGYHLKNLFIGVVTYQNQLLISLTGAEGTLGYITKVAIQLYPSPRTSFVVLARLNSYHALGDVLSSAKRDLGEILSAFEIFDSPSLELLQKLSPHLVQRFQDQLACDKECTYVVLETHSGSGNIEAQSERLEQFLEPLISSGIMSTAIISQDKSQEQSIWAIRENVPIALAQASKNNSTYGPFLLKYDISVPLHSWREVAEEVVVDLLEQGYTASYGQSSQTTTISEWKKATSFEVFCFGHAGDQNLHLNVLLSLNQLEKLNIQLSPLEIKSCCKNALESAVLKAVVKRNGSMSAEHGIGQQKKHLMKDLRKLNELNLMKSMKGLFDPKFILNPGKII